MGAMDLATVLGVIAVGTILVGLSIPLAMVVGALDRPGSIKVHERPTPRLGGLGIVVSFLAGAVATSALTPLEAAGLAMVALVGLADDCRSVSPLVRLLAEIAAGLVLALEHWAGSFEKALLLVVTVPLLTNGMNLIDGLNGLAAGAGIVSAVGLAAYLVRMQLDPTIPLLLIAGLAGFLPWNFPSARVFMGDLGSLSTGYILALVLARTAHGGLDHYWPALLMVGYPLFDLCIGVIRRWRRKRPLFEGDRDHTYDRLAVQLKSPKLATLVAWVICGLFVALGWMLRGTYLLLAAPLVGLLGCMLGWLAWKLGSL